MSWSEHIYSNNSSIGTDAYMPLNEQLDMLIKTVENRLTASSTTKISLPSIATEPVLNDSYEDVCEWTANGQGTFYLFTNSSLLYKIESNIRGKIYNSSSAEQMSNKSGVFTCAMGEQFTISAKSPNSTSHSWNDGSGKIGTEVTHNISYIDVILANTEYLLEMM